jgi:KilA-N domain
MTAPQYTPVHPKRAKKDRNFMKKQVITVQGREISVFSKHEEDYISVTDIARHKNPEEPKDIVKNWMRSKTTIEFLGLWEKLHNPNFKGVEFDSFMYQAGSNAFVLSPSKWIESTNAVGIISKPGNNGGTFAHRDIAFEFATWATMRNSNNWLFFPTSKASMRFSFIKV